MEIEEVKNNKKRFLPLLLLADEQESMIDRYLERGTFYILKDNGVKSVCVVTDEGEGVLELKNLATEPAFQRRGYGKALVDFLCRTYQSRYKILQVGTGEVKEGLAFYQKCGFSYSHRVEGFFLQYDHPIYDHGVLLRDMIYLRKYL